MAVQTSVEKQSVREIETALWSRRTQASPKRNNIRMRSARVGARGGSGYDIDRCRRGLRCLS